MLRITKGIALVLMAAAAFAMGCDDSSGSGSQNNTNNTTNNSNNSANNSNNSANNINNSANNSNNSANNINNSANNSNNNSGWCDEVPMFDQGKNPSAMIYVAPDGDDNSGDGSYDSPYATLGKAVQDAVPGTSIVLKPGEYSGDIYIENLRGTADDPIWIGGEGIGGTVKIDASGSSEAIHMSRVAYLVLHDMDVGGSDDNGINCDDGGDTDDPQATHHIVFRNLYIHDVGGDGNQDCLKLSGLNDFVVYGSEITRCGGDGSGSAIDCVGCHRGIIAQSYLHNLSGNAVQAKGGSEGLEIWANLIENPGERGINMGGNTGAPYFRPPLSDTEENFEARDIHVIANVITGGVTPFAFVGCVECMAVNNIIVNPETWLFRILQETTSSSDYDFAPCRDGLVANNIFQFEAGQIRSYVNIGPDTAPDTFMFMNNLWYASDNPSQSNPASDLPTPESGGIYGQDPGLVGVEYVPSQSGPAAGAGVDLDVLGGDYNGKCFASPPSIGAYELQ